MSPFWGRGQSIAVVAKGGTPWSFYWRDGYHRVEGLSVHWRVHSYWWSGEVWRDYWEVTTKTGLLCVLYQDLLSNAWYLERIYE